MFLIYIMLTLAVAQCSKSQRDSIPVFILDHDGVMTNILVQPNPFEKLTSPEFIEIIHDAQKNSKVVILFIENIFSFEDISVKDKKGSPFSNLHRGLNNKRVMYLPSVSQPYKALKQIFHPQSINEFHLSSLTTKLQVYDGKSKYFYIYFQDNDGETRAESLRNHDSIIQEVYSTVRQIYAGPAVAFYTGKVNSIPIAKMSFVTVKPISVTRNPGFTIRSTGALFRLIGVYTTAGNRRSMFSQEPEIAEETWTKHHLSTKMAYNDFELQFNFKLDEDFWTIDNVMLLEGGEEVGRSELRAGARMGQSFVCGEPLVIVNMRDRSAVTVTQYQIQPFAKNIDLYDDPFQTLSDHLTRKQSNDSNKNKSFGDAINCGPYFNTRILASLMVTFICLGILTYGFLTIFNCGANDRYDDPHGKPLTIPTEGHH